MKPPEDLFVLLVQQLFERCLSAYGSVLSLGGGGWSRGFGAFGFQTTLSCSNHT